MLNKCSFNNNFKGETRISRRLVWSGKAKKYRNENEKENWKWKWWEWWATTAFALKMLTWWILCYHLVDIVRLLQILQIRDIHTDTHTISRYPSQYNQPKVYVCVIYRVPKTRRINVFGDAFIHTLTGKWMSYWIANNSKTSNANISANMVIECVAKCTMWMPFCSSSMSLFCFSFFFLLMFQLSSRLHMCETTFARQTVRERERVMWG